METKVISARVPLEFANNLQDYCNRQGITISKYLQDGFSSTPSDGAQFGKIDVPADTKETLLATGGGSAIGILTYKGAKYALKGKVDDEELEIYSAIAGVAVGLLSAWGISKLIK